MASLREEKKLWKKGYTLVVGLDEAGRGCLGGPVVAAAVMIKKFSIFNFQFSNIKDSKKLNPKKREEFYKILTKNPNIEWAIGKVSEKVIDKINILEATKLAMFRALKNLRTKLIAKNKCGRTYFSRGDFLVLDGKMKLDWLIYGERTRAIPQKSIVKADEKVFSCTCASILAKVTRDRIMMRYHKKYPQYGFEKHKGYPTKLHLKMLKKYDPCKIHRKSFNPIKTCKLK